MLSKLSMTSAVAAIAFSAALTATATPAAAKDWLRAMDRHYNAAEETKYTPKGDNPQWNFDLNTVVEDMAWRSRTARMLRDAPKPGATVRSGVPQLADRPESRRLQYRF